MKTTILAAAIAVFGAGMALADPVVGNWKTQPDDNGNYGVVKISKCGSQICGVLGQGYDKGGKPVKSDNIGKKMIWGMNADGGGAYSGGKIWAPDRNKTYSSKMKLKGNRLEVKGCVLGICRGQTWSRM